MIEQAKRLEAIGQLESAIDLIHDRVDEMFRAGQFHQCNEMVKSLCPQALSTDMIFSVLVATLPTKSKLEARTEFFQKAEKAVSQRPEWKPGMLDNLK